MGKRLKKNLLRSLLLAAVLVIAWFAAVKLFNSPAVPGKMPLMLGQEKVVSGQQQTLKKSAITLFFPDSDFNGFLEFQQQLAVPQERLERLRFILAHYFNDQRNPLALPSGQKIFFDLYFTDSGKLFLDLDRQLLTFAESATNDYYFFTSLAKTLLYNCRSCRSLRILFDGQEPAIGERHLDFKEDFFR